MLIVMTGSPPSRWLGRRRIQTFKWLAEQASKHKLPLYIVGPTDISFKDGIPEYIIGYFMNEEKTDWTKTTVRVVKPIWLDFMYLKELQRQQVTYKQLKRAIRCSGAKLLNSQPFYKNDIYRILNTSNLNSISIPDTKNVRHPPDIHAFLDEYQVGWLKPVNGSGGRDIIRIEQHKGNLYSIHSDSLRGRRVVKILTPTQFTQFVRHQLEKRKYVIQEEVHLPRLKNGDRLDFRVTVQRDETGLWKVTSTTLRRSGKGSVVTNYHAGGKVQSISSPGALKWFHSARLTQDDRTRVELVAVQVAQALQRKYPDLAYLGVDAAPTKTGCYIYDCNSRPGRDILTDAQVHLMIRRLIGFISFLRKSSTYQTTHNTT